MTTQVKVTACCSSDKEVEIKISGKLDKILQDRESYEDVVYDDVCIAVRERMKRIEQPPCDNDHVAEGCEKFSE